jgi:hypothetical protein
MNWKEFLGMHRGVLLVPDFDTAQVWTWCGLVARDVLFFVRIAAREVRMAAVIPYPDKRWMRQIASNVTMAE